MQYRVRGNDGRERSVSLAAIQTAYANRRPGDATVSVRADSGEDVPVLLRDIEPVIASTRTGAPATGGGGSVSRDEIRTIIAEELRNALGGYVGGNGGGGDPSLGVVLSEVRGSYGAQPVTGADARWMSEVERIKREQKVDD